MLPFIIINIKYMFTCVYITWSLFLCVLLIIVYLKKTCIDIYLCIVFVYLQNVQFIITAVVLDFHAIIFDFFFLFFDHVSFFNFRKQLYFLLKR